MPEGKAPLLFKHKIMKKKGLKKAKDAGFVPMAVVNPHAAGIDVGDTIHAVAVPVGRDVQSVRTFGAMSCDLEEIVAWLEKCGIDTVAMESTGIYWKSLAILLIQHDFEVYLVNARHVRNVSGRKTDQGDAEWIQQLHSCGLLKSSYLPEDIQESLRTLVRYRRTLTQESSRFVLRIQKALEMMNVKLHTEISDLTGKTGMAIVEAIISGERNAANFLPLVDHRIKADREDIKKSLQGNWRDEQLFTLEENYTCYKFFLERIAKCDKAIEAKLQEFAAAENEGELPTTVVEKKDDKKTLKKKNKNSPKFAVSTYLKSILGVDVLAIYGLNEVGAMEILAETGTDMSKWETVEHFRSWLNLCPNNKITGGKLVSSKLMKKKANPASQAFRKAANACQRSDHWLGDYFRRMKAKGGNKYAIVATANKIATIYYKMVSEKIEFNPPDLTEYQEQRKNAKIAYLERALNALKKDSA